MFTTDDLRAIAHKITVNESEDEAWQEAGALFQRRYGRHCHCGRIARRLGCRHVRFEHSCMRSFARALDLGLMADYVREAEATDCIGVDYSPWGTVVKVCTCPRHAAAQDCHYVASIAG